MIHIKVEEISPHTPSFENKIVGLRFAPEHCTFLKHHACAGLAPTAVAVRGRPHQGETGMCASKRASGLTLFERQTDQLATCALGALSGVTIC